MMWKGLLSALVMACGDPQPSVLLSIAACGCALSAHLTGTNRGRAVTLTGNTLSRFDDGLIAEDWGSTNTIELARQLGIWRTVVMAVTEWRLLLKLSRH